MKKKTEVMVKKTGNVIEVFLIVQHFVYKLVDKFLKKF